LRFTPFDLYLVPFSLLWAGFALFWEVSVIRSRASVLFALWGVPFILVGVYLVAGRFFYRAWKRKRTVYAVTNWRVLALEQMCGRRLHAVSLRGLTAVSKAVHRDGRSVLRFGQQPWPLFDAYADAGLDLFGVSGAPLVFYDVEDVDGVYDLVNRVMAGRE
ncbi:MAG TPA: hypothetical protein VH916_07615, partial [Dehalococcoidia bacterium]